MTAWDNPTEGVAGVAPSPTSSNRGVDDFLDPLVFARFVFANLGKILVLSTVLFVLGLIAFLLIPFPYKATAIILVDPREKGVTISEQVVTNIDGDAAVLESIVELVQSDGFIRPLLGGLNLSADPQFQAVVATAPPGDDRQLLRAFKKGLNVVRLGATYVVEVSYLSSDPTRSAAYANGVANAFVDDQRSLQAKATETAANSLSERLTGLRDALRQSEKAVADFRAEKKIVSVDSASTLQQRELSELSQQVAQAKTNTEVARAEYDQLLNSDSNFGSLGDQTNNQQLQSLEQQRSVINQNIAELNLTFGDRHPRIAAERSKLTSLNQQIERERQRMIALGKKKLDAAEATQRALQTDFDELKNKASDTETSLVKLAELEREASANRQIYENFLNRFKSADGQLGFETQQARLVSPASAPLTSTRPNLALVGGVLGLLSFVTSIVMTLTLDILRSEKAAQPQAVASNELAMQPASSTNPPTVDFASMTASPPPRSKKSLSELVDVIKSRIPDLKTSGQTAQLDEPALSEPRAGPFHFQSKQTARKEEQKSSFTPSFSTKPPTHKERSENLQGSPLLQPKQSPSFSYSASPPILGLSHIPHSAMKNDLELEQALAQQMAPNQTILPADGHHSGGTVILVSSWFEREGKTTVAQALAMLAAQSSQNAILIKTPLNAAVEYERGASSARLLRPYTILDPAVEAVNGNPMDFADVHAMGAIIAECRNTFGTVVLDASKVGDETSINELSNLCDKTLIVFDRPDDQKIEVVVDNTTQSNLRNPDIVLNNL